MVTRLRNAKKANKGIGGKGKGKLTDKIIGDLTKYYGLAIKRNPNSLEDMKTPYVGYVLSQKFERSYSIIYVQQEKIVGVSGVKLKRLKPSTTISDRVPQTFE